MAETTNNDQYGCDPLATSFMLDVRTLVADPKYSDVTVEIKAALYGKNDVKLSSKRRKVEPKREYTIKIPCHTFILRMNSEYFVRALDFPQDPPQQEANKVVDVHVDQGYSSAAEKLIKSQIPAKRGCRRDSQSGRIDGYARFEEPLAEFVEDGDGFEYFQL